MLLSVRQLSSQVTCNTLYRTGGQAEELCPSACATYIHVRGCARTIRAVRLLIKWNALERAKQIQRGAQTMLPNGLCLQTKNK